MSPASYRRAVRILLAAYALYAAAYIARTSFDVAGQRTFALFDDAMVSMRYARNLSQGNGPVWNAGGERVEGYTNPLWVLYMAGLHRLPVAPAQISLLVQLTGAALLGANLLLVRRLADELSGSAPLAGLGAVALTAFYAPLNNWGLLGMEVSALVALTTLAAWLALRDLRRGTATAWLYVALGTSLLLRLDALVPFATIWLFLLAGSPGRRREHLAFGLVTLALGLLPQTAFRVWYYGDWLPNTYYLKVTGLPLALRLGRGLYLLAWFVWRANFVLLLVPLGVLLFRRDRPVWLLLALFGAQAAYSVYVGGDSFESWGGANRYLCLAMPGLFVLLAVTLDHFVRLGDPAFVAPRRLVTALARPLHDARVLLTLIVLATVFSFAGGLPGAGLWTAGIGLALLPVLLAARVVERRRAVRPPAPPAATYAAPLAGRAPLWLAGFIALALLNLNATYGPAALGEWLLLREVEPTTSNREMVALAGTITRISDGDASMAVVLAGTLPYFAERPAVDLLGKSDRVVAHGPMRLLPAGAPGLPFGFWPGHSKWDYAHSIGVLRPDIVAQSWWIADQLAGDPIEAYLGDDYEAVVVDGQRLYLRRGSPHIYWDQVSAGYGRLPALGAGCGAQRGPRHPELQAFDKPRGIVAYSPRPSGRGS